jgi:uncharacterized membrane protein YeaQ/YmgE (transglycosylase-associated protein family)
VDVNAVVETAQHWTNAVLVRIGFGTVVGLLAKAVMPGRDEGGPVATVLMGVGGSVVGSGLLALFWEGHRVAPTSLLGFAAATAGAFLLLFFHRLLRGSFFREEGTGTQPPPRPRRRRVAVVAEK